jgi:hypothetical protein
MYAHCVDVANKLVFIFLEQIFLFHPRKDHKLERIFGLRKQMPKGG